MGHKAIIVALAVLVLAACSHPAAPQPSNSPPRHPGTAVPAYDHIVLVMLENKDFSQVADARAAPYLNSLARSGAAFTQSYAITHPSQPNYIALFSGSPQGVVDDSCPHIFVGTPNLASQLAAAGRSFVGYSEGMPHDGYTGCKAGRYARKHNAWVNFTTVPETANLTWQRFPTDFATLPSVAFVTPDLCSDMHDCGIDVGDRWIEQNLSAYASWASAHNSLLIATFDENDNRAANQIFTVFAGAHVRSGEYPERIDHYRVLHTIEAVFGLEPLGAAAATPPIVSCWN